jgi:16S rRNA processing protein RimM
LSRSDGSDRPSVRAGRLGRPHGLNGYLGLYVELEDVIYFEPGSTVFIQDRPYVVRAVRRADKGHHVAFKNVLSREDAETIRNEDVLVVDRRTLDSHEFWPDDLVGLEVRPSGGKVVAVKYGPGQDRLVIERAGTRFEIPFVDPLVPVVDIEAGYIETAEIDGLTEPSE